MALSGKYGKLEIPKVGEDEPVFILRAQDRLAEFAVKIYGTLAASHGAPVAEGLSKEVRLFKDWKGPKKLPD